MKRDTIFIIDTISIIILPSILVTLIITVNASILEQPISRTFEHCPEVNIPSGISYDIVGCPTSSIIVHDWNNISISNQTLIISELNSKGYTDKGSIDNNTNVTTIEHSEPFEDMR